MNNTYSINLTVISVQNTYFLQTEIIPASFYLFTSLTY